MHLEQVSILLIVSEDSGKVLLFFIYGSFVHAYGTGTHVKYAVCRYTVGCALTFASEAKMEIEAKISFRFEAKKKPDFT